MKLILLSLCLILLGNMAWGQPNPDTLWTRVYNGDEAHAIEACSDGGYIIAGNIGFPYDAYLLKIDVNGEVEWEQSYGTQQGFFEDFLSINQTIDGNFVAVGHLFGWPDFPYPAYYLVKTNSMGDTLFTRIIQCQLQATMTDIKVTPDGGFAVIGYSECDTTLPKQISLFKYDSLGNVEWSRSYGNNFVQHISHSLLLASDGGYLIAGNEGNLDEDLSTRMYVIRTNSVGDTLWTRTYSGDTFTTCGGIDKTIDGGYVLCGFVNHERRSQYDIYVAKIDSVGNQEWVRRFGGSLSDLGKGIQQIADRGYIVFGMTRSYGVGNFDYFLLRLSGQGDSLWLETYGGTDYENCASGLINQERSYVLLGKSYSYHGIYVVKTGSEPLSVTEPLNNFFVNEFTFDCYPNPFNFSAEIRFNLSRQEKIKLSVYDVLGREVAVLADVVMSAGEHRMVFDGKNLASGIYFARVEIAPPSVPPAEARGSFGSARTIKMVLLK